MKYKQEEQDFASGAKMESPDEPLCKGRNQIVIVADTRVPQWSKIQSDTSLLKSLRNFQTTNGTENSTNYST